MIRLRDRLLRAEEELLTARCSISELTLKNMQYAAELKRERYINEIAQQYIPEDMLAEYYAEYPKNQPTWTSSSPAPRKL